MKKYTIRFTYNTQRYPGDTNRAMKRRTLFSNHLSGAIRRVFAEYDGVELVEICEK